MKEEKNNFIAVFLNMQKMFSCLFSSKLDKIIGNFNIFLFDRVLSIAFSSLELFIRKEVTDGEQTSCFLQ